MKNIKITAKYISKNGWVDEDNPSMIYKVRELNESLTGKKRIHLWGFNDPVPIEEVELMINGVVVNWI